MDEKQCQSAFVETFPQTGKCPEIGDTASDEHDHVDDDGKYVGITNEEE